MPIRIRKWLDALICPFNARLWLAGGVAAALVAFVANAAPDPSALWNQALQHLDGGRSEEAIESWQRWREQFAGAAVPELHANLAVAYSRQKDWGPAVYHLAASARLDPNPWSSHQAVRRIIETENRNLVPQPASRGWAFYVQSVVPRGLAVWAGSVAIWVLAFAAYMRRRSWLVAAGAVGLIALFSWAAQESFSRFGPHFGVVQGDGVVLRAGEQPNSDELATLPPGTVVGLPRPAATQSVQITAPFVGWLPADSVRLMP